MSFPKVEIQTSKSMEFVLIRAQPLQLTYQFYSEKFHFFPFFLSDIYPTPPPPIDAGFTPSWTYNPKCPWVRRL